MPLDFYYIAPKTPHNTPAGAPRGSDYMIRTLDGQVLFPKLKADIILAQEICAELNACRDASTAR